MPIGTCQSFSADLQTSWRPSSASSSTSQTELTFAGWIRVLKMEVVRIKTGEVVQTKSTACCSAGRGFRDHQAWAYLEEGGHRKQKESAGLGNQIRGAYWFVAIIQTYHEHSVC